MALSFSYESTGFQDPAVATAAFTFTAQGIGTAASDRWVIVSISSRTANAGQGMTCTIGGVEAELIVYSPSAISTVNAIAYAPVPSGTTADIVVGFPTTNAVSCKIATYRSSGGEIAVKGVATGGGSVTLEGDSGGWIIGSAKYGTATPTFTNATKDTESAGGGTSYYAGFHASATGATTISHDSSSAVGMLAVAFGERAGGATLSHVGVPLANSNSLVSVTYPDGLGDGDLLVSGLALKIGSASTPTLTLSGHTMLDPVRDGTTASGVDSGSMLAGWGYRVLTADPGGPDTWGPSTGAWAATQAFGFTKSAGETWNVAGFTGADTDATGTGVSATIAGTSGNISAGDLLLIMVPTTSDTTVNHSSQSFTVPGLTLGTVQWLSMISSSAGSDGKAYFGFVPVLSGTASGDASYTATSSTSGKSAAPVAVVRVRSSTSTTAQASGTVSAASTAAGDPTARAYTSGTVAAVSATAGTVASRLLSSGTVAAVSSAPGAVTSKQLVSGLSSASSAASGAVSKVHPVASSPTAAVATAAGTATSKQLVSGAVTATSAASGTASKVHPAAGTASASSSVSGIAEIVTGATTYQVSGSVAAVAVVAGAPTALILVSGTVAGTSTASGVVYGNLAASGTVSAASVVMGTATLKRPAVGTSVAASSASGAVTSKQLVSGAVASQSSTAGTVSRVHPVSGAVSASSGASGAAEIVAGPVTYPVDGTVSAVLQVFGAVGLIQQVPGSVSALSALSGTTTQDHAASAQVNADSAASGSVSTVHVMNGAVLVGSSAAGSVSAIFRVSGEAASEAGASASPAGIFGVSGAVTALFIISGKVLVVFGTPKMSQANRTMTIEPQDRILHVFGDNRTLMVEPVLVDDDSRTLTLI